MKTVKEVGEHVRRTEYLLCTYKYPIFFCVFILFVVIRITDVMTVSKQRHKMVIEMILGVHFYQLSYSVTLAHKKRYSV